MLSQSKCSYIAHQRLNAHGAQGLHFSAFLSITILTIFIQVIKENVKSVLGIENSLLDFTDKHLQTLQSEMKNMRDTLEELKLRLTHVTLQSKQKPET